MSHINASLWPNGRNVPLSAIDIKNKENDLLRRKWNAEDELYTKLAEKPEMDDTTNWNVWNMYTTFFL